MIETKQQLLSLMQRAQTVDAVGVDTEFVWERTYYPRLGLIQLALSAEECFLIDPLLIDDLSSFGDLLVNENVVKIFHDGPGDLAILRQVIGVDPKNIFDTRLAAGFAGLPSILSLLVLVEKLLDISLNKSQTRTNWLKRPLTAHQMKYGLEDVRYLRQVRRLLMEAVQPEVTPWLTEELRLLDVAKNYTGLADEQRYIKVNGGRRLNRRGLAVLRGLALWREEVARYRNKPRGHIIKDEVLVFMAQEQLDDVAKLHGCEGISAKSISRYGKELVQVVRKALEAPEESDPELLRTARLNREEQTDLRRLQAFIGQKCEQLGLDPALLGNKAELTGFIQQTTASVRQRGGWRKEFLAEFSQNRA